MASIIPSFLTSPRLALLSPRSQQRETIEDSLLVPESPGSGGGIKLDGGEKRSFKRVELRLGGMTVSFDSPSGCYGSGCSQHETADRNGRHRFAVLPARFIYCGQRS